MKGSSIGRYRHADSPIHRLDPRTKLISLISIIVSVSLVEKPFGLLIISLFIMAVVFLSHLRIWFVMRSLRPVLSLLVSIVILHGFFTDGGSMTLFSLGPVKTTIEGLYKGIRMSYQFLLIFMSASILTLTTMPIQIADGIAEVLRPLRRVGIPVQNLPLMIMISLNFIPLLFAEGEKLMLVQRARGAQLRSRDVLKRQGILVSVFIPLLRNSLRIADELAVGMEARGYHSGNRSHLNGLRFSMSDVFALSITIAIALSAIAVDKLLKAI